MEITVYGTHTCPHCINVESFLQTKGASFDQKIIGEDVSIEQLEETVGRPVRTVPVIVVDGDELSFSSLKLKLSMADLSL